MFLINIKAFWCVYVWLIIIWLFINILLVLPLSSRQQESRNEMKGRNVVVMGNAFAILLWLAYYGIINFDY